MRGSENERGREVKRSGEAPTYGDVRVKLNRLLFLLLSMSGRDSWWDLGTITRNKSETKEMGTGAQQCQIDVESHVALRRTGLRGGDGRGRGRLSNCLDNPGKIKVPFYFKVKEVFIAVDPNPSFIIFLIGLKQSSLKG